MERASAAFVHGVLSRFSPATSVTIFCGPGNNGGDGLAVARLLKNYEFTVEVFVIRSGSSESSDFTANYDRLVPLLDVKTIEDSQDFPEIPRGTIVIDAIFGSGLDRPATGVYGEVIDHINSSEATVISIDIASGLNSDQATGSQDKVVEPDTTVSFQIPKLALLMPENDRNVGEWFTADIGLDQEYINQMETPYYELEASWIASMLGARSRHSHKGVYGKALLVEGSLGKMGAAILSGKACMRSGAGLLTLHVPRCGYQIVQTALPEAMVDLDHGQEFIESLPDELDVYQAIGVGPGISTHSETAAMLRQMMTKIRQPLLLDADAINILSSDKQLIGEMPPDSIITPHPKEFERLVGPSENNFHRLEQQLEFSQSHKCYLILKGANTCIATPDGQAYFNSTGNPGMATAGSGDVLTGMITSLLAQGHKPLAASLIGVFLHGLAGDLARDLKGEEALIASDIIECLPAAFASLRSQGSE